ncbi:MAG: hypothetical protein HOV68_33280 [Streptomycetaceae bacterium]|nr:hypothetical protein [Streptomycetaceae bacterium]
MVTSNHEAVHRIFQDHPELFAPVFKTLGMHMPENACIGVVTPDVTEIHPLERRIDGVFKIDQPDGPGLMLAVEAQQRRDKDKAVSWAYYLAYLKSKYKRPALLLVLGGDQTTADWASGPFALGPLGWTSLYVHPLVLGPNNAPLILDPEQAAENLLLATFAAMTQGEHKQGRAILDALARALGRTDRASAHYFGQWVELGLANSPAGKVWSDLMVAHNYFPHRKTMIGTALEEGEAKGFTRGTAQGILRVLDARRIPTTPEIRDRVTDCDDRDTLDLWLARAAVANDVNELFVEESQ